MVTAAGFCFQMEGQIKRNFIMPQIETVGSESPETDRVEEDSASEPSEPGAGDGGDASGGDDLVDPSTLEIPTEPLPEPPVRITIIPGRETDEDVEPGEEVPNIEVDVTTEPR